MNGCILPGTSIAVDYWQVKKHAGIKLFFLTHLHGDHMVGLTSSWRHPIYCSPVTGQLLIERYGIDRSLVRCLEVNESHLIGYCHGNCAQSASNHQYKNGDKKGLFKPPAEHKHCSLISVTVIAANHCVGSVMFLFEGPFGKILHTGDFRYSTDMFETDSPLSKHIGTIDTVYLDNTYCCPKCTFPSRYKVLNDIVDIVKSHNGHDIVFGVRGFGKEELLAAVALSVEEWINVPPSTLSFVQSIGLPNVFQTGQPDSRLRVAPFHSISSEFVRTVNKKKPTIFILPTALYQGICGKPFANMPEVFVFPYSDHSSFTELCQFVLNLQPGSVRPIVCGKARGPFGVDISKREDMSYFSKYLKPRRHDSMDSSIYKPKDLGGCIYSHGQDVSVDGFESLFPDFKQSGLKRKGSFHKRANKSLCSKGVTYISDDELEVMTPHKQKKSALVTDDQNPDHEHGDNTKYEGNTEKKPSNCLQPLECDKTFDFSSEALVADIPENVSINDSHKDKMQCGLNRNVRTNRQSNKNGKNLFQLAQEMATGCENHNKKQNAVNNTMTKTACSSNSGDSRNFPKQNDTNQELNRRQTGGYQLSEKKKTDLSKSATSNLGSDHEHTGTNSVAAPVRSTPGICDAARNTYSKDLHSNLTNARTQNLDTQREMKSKSFQSSCTDDEKICLKRSSSVVKKGDAHKDPYQRNQSKSSLPKCLHSDSICVHKYFSYISDKSALHWKKQSAKLAETYSRLLMRKKYT